MKVSIYEQLAAYYLAIHNKDYQARKIAFDLLMDEASRRWPVACPEYRRWYTVFSCTQYESTKG